jgi:hypothetical protein
MQPLTEFAEAPCTPPVSAHGESGSEDDPTRKCAATEPVQGGIDLAGVELTPAASFNVGDHGPARLTATSIGSST